LLHAAEGLLFRTAIADAVGECGFTVVAVQERDLKGRVATLPRPQGPPWREDEKLATVAALIALGPLGHYGQV
jgi:hypothetical protein